MPTDASVFEAEHIAAVAAALSDSCRVRLLATLLDTDELSAERLSDAISEPVSVVGNQLAASSSSEWFESNTEQGRTITD